MHWIARPEWLRQINSHQHPAGLLSSLLRHRRIFGKDIQTHVRELRSQIGYMPESDAFLADMTGVRFVRYMAELSGLPADEAMERAHEAFFYVGLGEARYRKVGTYSLGMKQLAKLAQAIAHGPKLLLLDEPTNGLDPEARQRMLQLVRDIRDAGQSHGSDFFSSYYTTLKNVAMR